MPWQYSLFGTLIFYATQKYICDTSVVFTQGQMNEKNTGFLLSVQRRIPTRSSHEFWIVEWSCRNWWCSYALEVHFDTKQLSCQVKSAQLLSGVSIFGFTTFFPPSSSLAALCVSLATCNSFRFWKLATLLMRWCCDLYLHFSTCAIMTKCRKQLTFSMNFLFKATKLRQEILGIWQPKFCQNACEKFHYFHSFFHE